jgi:hypothetical protein
MKTFACCSPPWCLSSRPGNWLPIITVCNLVPIRPRSSSGITLATNGPALLLPTPPSFRPGCDHANRPVVEPKPYAALLLLNFLIYDR